MIEEIAIALWTSTRDLAMTAIEWAREKVSGERLCPRFSKYCPEQRLAQLSLSKHAIRAQSVNSECALQEVQNEEMPKLHISSRYLGGKECLWTIFHIQMTLGAHRYSSDEATQP